MNYEPYTYLIGWSNNNKFYYGVRYAKNCHPSDLWTKYFTSSGIVKEYREQYGEPDIIQVRKIFKDGKIARLWEEKVLIRMNVVVNENFLNKTDKHAPPNNPKFGSDNGMFGKTHSEETKRKMSISRSGEKNGMWNNIQSLEARKKISDFRKQQIGWNHKKETIDKMVKNGSSAAKSIMKESGKNRTEGFGYQVTVNNITYKSIKDAINGTGLTRGKLMKIRNNQISDLN